MFGIGSGSDPANGGFGTHGWRSRSYKRYISKDRSLLKKLEDAWKGGNERERKYTSLENIRMYLYFYVPLLHLTSLTCPQRSKRRCCLDSTSMHVPVNYCFHSRGT